MVMYTCGFPQVPSTSVPTGASFARAAAAWGWCSARRPSTLWYPGLTMRHALVQAEKGSPGLVAFARSAFVPLLKEYRNPRNQSALGSAWLVRLLELPAAAAPILFFNRLLSAHLGRCCGHAHAGRTCRYLAWPCAATLFPAFRSFSPMLFCCGTAC